jgi:EPS-associated MarR family transcriptional regulator
MVVQKLNKVRFLLDRKGLSQVYYVQQMNAIRKEGIMNSNNSAKEETLDIINEIEDNPSINQRLISQKLNISLGKTNYLLKELAKKGVVKISSFSKNPKKRIKKLRYILTPKGIEEKITLTYHFLQVKEAQYNKLKKEYERYMGSSK